MDYVPIPTVVPFRAFNPEEDAKALRKAMKGFGTDEQAIINILTHRSNPQRQVIRQSFSQQFGRELIKDLKSELSGNLERVIVGLMLPPIDYLCKMLNKAMAGIGTDEEALVEILCTKSNDEIKVINKKYEEMYERPMVEHICTETSGHFRRFMTLIVTAVRDPPGLLDAARARQEASELFQAGEAKLGTDEHVFIRILAHGSFAHLRLVFEEYKKVSGMTIEQAIKHEMSGEIYMALMAIVEIVQSTPAFFARQLQKAMVGLGTNDSTLIRILVGRCELDLGNIKQEFERLYDRTLLSAVESETSGDYKKALRSLIGSA